MKKEKTKVDNENTIEKEEETNKADETLAKEIAKKRVPKQVSQEILKKIFKNLILAIVVMIYFISCNIIYTKLELEQMELITKAIAGVFLLASIIILEFAYKRDSGALTMTAIELLVLSIHALFIYHVITVYQFDFRTYLVTSSYIFAIYYVLKSTVIYTRARIQYLKSLSDISEIVKDEPIVKEAKKRNEEPVIDEKEEVEKEEVEKEKEEKKQKPKSMRGKARSKKTSSKNTKQENTEEDKEKETKKRKMQKKAVAIETKQENMESNQNKEEKETIVKKKQTTKKKGKEKEPKKEETKTEQQNKVQEEKESHKEEMVEEVKEQPKPKSKRGRKKKEEVVKDD